MKILVEHLWDVSSSCNDIPKYVSILKSLGHEVTYITSPNLLFNIAELSKTHDVVIITCPITNELLRFPRMLYKSLILDYHSLKKVELTLIEALLAFGVIILAIDNEQTLWHTGKLPVTKSYLTAVSNLEKWLCLRQL